MQRNRHHHHLQHATCSDTDNSIRFNIRQFIFGTNTQNLWHTFYRDSSSPSSISCKSDSSISVLPSAGKREKSNTPTPTMAIA